MSADPAIAIAPLSADAIQSHLEALGALLHACVLDGASVGFVLPFTPAEGEAYWRGTVLPRLRQDGVLLLAAKGTGGIAGTVLLDHDTPANQPHRAEVRKLLVHPAMRRRGIARALMIEVERHAVRLGRSLLTLDTRTGDMAEPLYASLGYQRAGIIPGYCRDARSERLDSTTIMYKAL